ncbi:unnamed protein product [Closterium sp. NIES-53]
MGTACVKEKPASTTSPQPASTAIAELAAADAELAAAADDVASNDGVGGGGESRSVDDCLQQSVTHVLSQQSAKGFVPVTFALLA